MYKCESFVVNSCFEVSKKMPYIGQQERKGFRSMIASSQFSNLQLGNSRQLATCNLATWQLSNSRQLATCNFGNLQIWQLAILTIFNYGYFQANFNTLVNGNPPFSACMDLAIKKTNLVNIVCERPLRTCHFTK